MQGDGPSRERRRESRFETQMWVGIQDTEGDSEVESCNISASGMLLRTPRDVGEPGTVRMLRLVTADLAAVVEVMSRVVRVETSQDRETGEIQRATAFEFMLQRPEELQEFLEIALASQLPGQGGVFVPPEGPLQATRLVLEADRPLEPGSRVRLEIRSAGGRIDWLTGIATESSPLDEFHPTGLYRVEIELGSDDANALEPGQHVPVDPGRKEVDPGRGRHGVHLAGSLSEIGMSGLLGFFELERASGVLCLEHEAGKASLFVRQGAIVDVESSLGGDSPMDALRTLLAWTAGSFEFAFQSVERPDVIQTSTTSILMECARLQDEGSRGLR